MVIRSAIAISSLFIGLYASADQLNYDNYMTELNEGQQKIDYSKTLVKHDQLQELLKRAEQDKVASEKTTVAVQSVPESASSPNDASGKGKHKSDAAAPEIATPVDETQGGAEPFPVDGQPYEADGSPAGSGKATLQSGHQGNGGYYYVAPALRRGGSQVSNDIVLARSNKPAAYFGIPIGAEISVDLKKSASNVQEGYVAMSVRFDIAGQQHSLSRNGTLFARPSAVKGSERLFLRVERGITSDGYEFTANGVVLGEDGKPGLMAKVISDGKVLDRAVNAGESTIAGAVVEMMAPDMASQAAKSGVEKVLEDKQQGDSDKTGQRAYIVLAEPQRATVQVEATF